MKTFKKIDVLIQLWMMPVLLLLSLFISGFFLYAYFILGGWQLLSAFIHKLSRNYVAVSGRSYYLPTALIFLVSAGLSLTTKFVLIMAFVMLICTPFIALWYLNICYRENRIIRNRETIQLK